MKIIKRNGAEVEFDKLKIVAAMLKAFKEQHETVDSDMMCSINKIAGEIERLSFDRDLHVEEIQDIVEKKLMATKYKEVAKAVLAI